MDDLSRRSLLMATGVGATSLLPGLPDAASAQAVSAGPGPSLKPTHRIRFAVIGLDHPHILSMTATVLRGGGELVSVYAVDPKQIRDFRASFGDVKLARSEAEILEDTSIQLVAGAPIPDQRTPLGLRVMRHGKDFLSDKPGIVTLDQLAEVRRTIAQTGRKFAIMYSERLEVPAAVKAGELVKAGAIGRVVQTINIAPHQINAPARPAWFFDRARYGGILTDIGSHQADQFLYYTGSKSAQVLSSQVANVSHKAHPEFQDFGDMTVTGDGGAGYIRVDWFTPDGLGTWGDGRLFILGTDGYIELRKFADPAGRKGGNHLFIVDKKQALYMDCNNVALPFGPQFVADIVNRTEIAQDQVQALLAAELVLTAQQNAKPAPFAT
ncbi:Gfo/Idh/MocA family protein [Caulobacter sp. S45]|jgi:predicted dehydrogenase|uniref:Gfo/Idh/MocA family protein n=1 Tax=Caulobacter sp. S45 TaxID=1641861 RepID=UPI00131DF1E4|nr:Gfo/Idh/MocA family oxidoreductase [Caulobacter sp. S45]